MPPNTTPEITAQSFPNVQLSLTPSISIPPQHPQSYQSSMAAHQPVNPPLISTNLEQRQPSGQPFPEPSQPRSERCPPHSKQQSQPSWRPWSGPRKPSMRPGRSSPLRRRRPRTWSRHCACRRGGRRTAIGGRRREKQRKTL